jgi:hypothetical protein
MVRMRRGCMALAVAVLLSACDRAPVAPDPNVIPGEYIVVFKGYVQDVPGLARRLSEQNHGTILSIWELALKGFAVRLYEPAGFFVARIRAHRDVAYVGPNHVTHGGAE